MAPKKRRIYRLRQVMERPQAVLRALVEAQRHERICLARREALVIGNADVATLPILGGYVEVQVLVIVRIPVGSSLGEDREGKWLENVRWFVMADDNTVFFIDNLATVLGKYDHNQMYYIGENFGES
ncbi:hypothetical protein L484_016992 [Morus notabilis]|uniref:Fringe-like glycosyltransferase domain-containing protein n=1 Tax=Morus notabilis TaxID=981085 RepID=W9R1T8_9ROSA|nr:hypothetical protein L484_016992 [Morus notabilis]